jgi:hypothetical protein
MDAVGSVVGGKSLWINGLEGLKGVGSRTTDHGDYGKMGFT